MEDFAFKLLHPNGLRELGWGGGGGQYYLLVTNRPPEKTSDLAFNHRHIVTGEIEWVQKVLIDHTHATNSRVLIASSG